MKNSTQLLEQLNQALKAINTAIKRGPLANSVSKENMLETKTLIQNSIKLIEAQIKDEVNWLNFMSVGGAESEVKKIVSSIEGVLDDKA